MTSFRNRKDNIKKKHVVSLENYKPVEYNSVDFKVFRRGGLIGRGAFAKVLQCNHDDLKIVAVKCYKINNHHKKTDKMLKR